MILELPDLSVIEIVGAVLIIFTAYVIKGLSGFGSGLVAIPLLAIFLPIPFIVPVLGLLSYSGTLMQSFSLRKHLAWKMIFPLMPFSFLGIFIAVWILSTVDAGILIFYLGLFILFYASYSLLPVQRFQQSRYWVVICGCFGGLVGALFGTGGPFYVVYLKTQQLNKAQFRATIASIFLIDGGARIVGYASGGFISGVIAGHDSGASLTYKSRSKKIQSTHQSHADAKRYDLNV